jgi:hypothetical protein
MFLTTAVSRAGVAQMRGKKRHHNLLSSDEDLEGADDLCQRDSLVCNPLFCRLCVVDEDNEVVLLALVVDLDLGCFTASHDCWLLKSGRFCNEFGEEFDKA